MTLYTAGSTSRWTAVYGPHCEHEPVNGVKLLGKLCSTVLSMCFTDSLTACELTFCVKKKKKKGEQKQWIAVGVYVWQ